MKQNLSTEKGYKLETQPEGLPLPVTSSIDIYVYYDPGLSFVDFQGQIANNCLSNSSSFVWVYIFQKSTHANVGNLLVYAH